MRLKNHRTAGLIMAAVKWIFDLCPRAGSSGGCVDHPLSFRAWHGQVLSLDGQDGQQA